jgi:hypothetical protein
MNHQQQRRFRDYWLDVSYDAHPYEMSWLLQSVTTDAGVAGFYEVTELGYLLSQSVGFVPGYELQHVIIPSVTVWTVCTLATKTDSLCSTQV